MTKAVVVGMNHRRPRRAADAFCGGFPGSNRWRTESDCASERFDGADLGPRTIFWHDDVRRNTASGRGEGQGGGVVSRGMGHDAISCLVWRQRHDGVARAPKLERARLLKVLALQK